MWKYIVIVSVFGVYLLKDHQISGQIFGYEPVVDYPAYESIPSGLTFRCSDKLPGYYADVEARCQVWHWCLPNGYMFSFLCPNGTVFNQVLLQTTVSNCFDLHSYHTQLDLTNMLMLSEAVRVCDWWTNVNCVDSEGLYDNNNDLYKDINGVLIAG